MNPSINVRQSKDFPNQSSFMNNLMETPMSPDRKQGGLLNHHINNNQDKNSKKIVISRYDQENMNSMNQDQFMTFSQSSYDKTTTDGGKSSQHLQYQNINEIRKSIMLRESKNNQCLNPPCLQTECCLSEANNKIALLRQQIDEIYLQLLDKEGQLLEAQERNKDLERKLELLIPPEKQTMETQTTEDLKEIALFNTSELETISSV